jgi:hypothetical protein
MVKDRPFAYRLKSVTKLPEFFAFFPLGLCIVIHCLNSKDTLITSPRQKKPPSLV